MRPAGWILLLLTLAALLAALLATLLGGLWSQGDGEAKPWSGAAPDLVRMPTAEAAEAATTSAPAATTRSDAIADAVPFVSESEDDGPIPNPVRDGIAVLLLDDARRPVAGRAIDVRWRKRWGDYGNDRGATDRDGRFATTIADAGMIEGVTVTDPVGGELETWFDFLPMADDPRTVLCVLPALQPLRVRVVDQRGRLVPGAEVRCEGGDHETAPREHALLPGGDDEHVATDGELVLHVPIGRHRLTAHKQGFAILYDCMVDVPVGGLGITLHVFDPTELHEVTVTVRGPVAVLEQPLWLSAFVRELPDLPQLPDGAEVRQRDLTSRRAGEPADGVVQYVVQAPDGPWRCSAHDQGWQWSGGVDVPAFATAVTMELTQRPAGPPRARLRCRLLLPDGQATEGEVMVHTSPDLFFGPRYRVDQQQPYVEVDAGGKACVSAWQYGRPPAIVGPIELLAGEQEVVLQFPPAGRVAGRVVDAEGRAVKATVSLRRPAGPLRALLVAAPEVLRSSATGDSHGTGDDGRFWFDHVGPGPHRLWVMPRATGWPALVDVVAGQQDIVVALGEGLADFARIEGRVTSSTTGAPLFAALTWYTENERHTTHSDADGRYAIALPPGPATLVAHARHCAWFAADQQRFAAGVHRRDVALEPSEPLFVKVRDKDGAVPEVEVRAFDAAGRQFTFLDHDGDTDDDVALPDRFGRVELSGLPFAPVRLRLTSDDERQLTMDTEVPADTPRDRDFEIVWRPDGGK